MSSPKTTHSQLTPSDCGRPPQRELDLMFDKAGDRILLSDFGGRFSLSRKVSSGGMSDVYEGTDLENGNKIALKIASSESIPLEYANRYITRESLALGKIRHPNIVSFFGTGQIEGRNYLVLEFVEGDSVDDRVRSRPFSWPDASAVLKGLSDALSAVHERGVVHADITANNVSLSPAPDGSVRPVLLDFGFVKFMDPILDQGRTPSEDVVLGTFRYLAPEMVFRAISPDFDHRADIYSLGVLAYRMLSGYYPFDGPTDYSILLKHRDEPPKPLSGLPGLPPEADRMILKALAKNPSERFQTMAELRSDLDRIPE